MSDDAGDDKAPEVDTDDSSKLTTRARADVLHDASSSSVKQNAICARTAAPIARGSTAATAA
jgi:hypothetical protein